MALEMERRSNGRTLDGNYEISLIVFFMVVFAILFPFRIKLHKIYKYFTGKAIAPRIFNVNFISAPLMGVMFLIITTDLPFTDLEKGLYGEKGSKFRPYSIVILFFSLSYQCLSLDLTGIFAYIALQVMKVTSGSGTKCWLGFFFLSAAITLVTSNDIVILTLTPIILYFCKYANCDPLPFLFAEFFSANVWSIALYIGNPTNIIMADSQDITFIDYSRWMAGPAVSAGLTLLLCLYLIFRKDIPTVILTPPIDPRKKLRDPQGAIFGLMWLLLTLVSFMLADFVGVELWQISLFFAFGQLFRDISYDFTKPTLHDLSSASVEEDEFEPLPKPNDMAVNANISSSNAPPHHSPLPNTHSLNDRNIAAHQDGGFTPSLFFLEEEVTPPRQADDLLMSIENDRSEASPLLETGMINSEQPQNLRGPQSDNDGSDLSSISYAGIGSPALLPENRSRDSAILRNQTILQILKGGVVYRAVSLMPWAVLPFIIGMFILVAHLDTVFVLHFMASAVRQIVQTLPLYFASVVTTLGCVLMSNVLNNQPMTMLMVHVVSDDEYEEHVENRLQRMVAYSVIIGSNLGADLTPYGALAGLMWRSILQSKNISVSVPMFLKYGVLCVFPMVLVSSLVLTLEFVL